MRIGHHSLLFTIGIAIILSFVILPTSTKAQEQDTGYQIVLSQQPDPTGYGSNVTFTAILTFPLTDAPIDPCGFDFIFDGQTYTVCQQLGGSFVGQSNGQATFQTRQSNESIGQHSISATFFVASTQTTIQSNTLIHTVIKADIGPFICLPNTENNIITVGQAIPILIQVNVADATYDVSFTGPTSITYSNLTLDSAKTVTVQAPSIQGNYTLQCRFNGTSLYNMQQSSAQQVVVSLNRQLGVRVYSNPTTIVPGTPATLYIVFLTPAGLPAPTGEFTLLCTGTSSTPIFFLGNESFSINTTFVSGCANGFSVLYLGDITYARTTVAFPLTNPPIPSSAPPATPLPMKPGKGSANATATPVLSPTNTSVPSALTPTPTTGDIAVSDAANTTPSIDAPTGKTGGGYLWLITVLVLLAFGGGATGTWLLRRRAQPVGVAVMSTSTPPPPFSEIPEPIQSPLDGDITQL